MNIRQEIVRFVREEEGAGIIEYSLIAAVMVGIIVGALYTDVGQAIQTELKQIGQDIKTGGVGGSS
jgi:Flp pilus assembly pilin Flp